MRLFVAVELPEPVSDELDRAVAAVRSDRDGLRWMPAARRHLTLAFFGEVAERRLAPITRRLARVARRYPPIRLACTGVGAFPQADRARVLWAGLSGDLRELTRLADSVAAAARHSGAPVERRRFHAHVTLARARPPTDLRPMLTRLDDFAGSAWQAHELCLIHSHTGPDPWYEPLARWPLDR